MITKRRLIWASQVVIAAAVAYFFYRSLRAHWTEFGRLDLEGTALDVRVLLAASVIVLATFALLIRAWTTLMRGWGNALDFRNAAAIWCFSNMGRYLPGKVWAVAGMAVMAKRAGVDPVAATGSAVLMQALALGTGVAVILGTAPGVSQTGAVLVVLGIAAATVAVLSSNRALALATRVTGRELRPISPLALAAAAIITAASWVLYGLSFWAVLEGVLGDTGVTVWAATGYFATSYIMGFVAVFAPGGIGVREGVMISLLAPAVGGAHALVVAVVARLVFTVSELIAVLIVIPFAGNLRGLKQP